uniref:Family with sequence similarity 186 member A n=1 Tax=Otolemur garnettii TaxID=30611 RepID=H0XZW3_OTOGA
QDIDMQLKEIMENVNNIIIRYAVDLNMSTGRRSSLTEFKKRKRTYFLDKMATYARNAEVREKTLAHILSWLEEWKDAILSEMTVIDADEYHRWMVQMEMLPETLKAIENNVKILSRFTLALLEEKKKRKKKTVSRVTLWKTWKERVTKRPGTAHALRADQLISDQYATNTKVSEIQDMLQELIDTAMFNKLENSAIKYISSTILNLSKALSMIHVGDSSDKEKELTMKIIEDLTGENETLQQKLQVVEEKCEQLLRIKAATEPPIYTSLTWKMLPGSSPQASNAFMKETSQSETSLDLPEQQQNLPEKKKKKAPEDSSEDIIKDNIPLKPLDQKPMEQKKTVSFMAGSHFQKSPINAKSESSKFLSPESADPVINKLIQTIVAEIESKGATSAVPLVEKDHKKKEKQRQEQYLQVGQEKSSGVSLKQQLLEEINLSTRRQMKGGKQRQQKQEKVGKKDQRQNIQKEIEQEEKQKQRGEEEEEHQKLRQEYIEAREQKMKEQGMLLEKEKGETEEETPEELFKKISQPPGTMSSTWKRLEGGSLSPLSRPRLRGSLSPLSRPRLRASLSPLSRPRLRASLSPLSRLRLRHSPRTLVPPTPGKPQKDKTRLLTSDTKKPEIMVPPSSPQEIEEKRYFIDVEAQRKNLILLNQATKTFRLPSQLYTTAKSLVIETLHMDAVRLGYLFRKYIAYRLIQSARNNITKQLKAIQNTGKGYETQNLYTMLSRIDDYRKKVMSMWTEKQMALEQKRNLYLREMIHIFGQVIRFPFPLSRMLLSKKKKKKVCRQPIALIDKKHIPMSTPYVQQPFLQLLKFCFFILLPPKQQEEQMEAIWNVDLSISSYPIAEKTSMHSLWAQLGGYPDIPRLLQLDI